MSTVLVIDNYDSFTYNLVQYLGELGASVVVHRNDAIGIAAVESLGADGIVISPGPCTPDSAGISVELVRRFAGTVPVLGVCLGHQAIGAAFGAVSCATTASSTARRARSTIPLSASYRTCRTRSSPVATTHSSSRPRRYPTSSTSPPGRIKERSWE